MSDQLSELKDVTRTYDGGRVMALLDVSLSVRRGEFLAVMGPSGSGKSTLLHVLSGLDRPSRGRVLFENAEPRSVGRWCRIRALRIGFVFQDFNLLPTLSALENVQVPMLGVVRGSRARRDRAVELLARVGLGNRILHRPAELSGGERQRVAIARALANQPALLLADEPTGNLDSKTSAEIMKLLCELHAEQGTTLVVVTHDQDIAGHAMRIVRMLDGQVAGGSGEGAP